ncbi:hypothetical protein E2C01_026306 [Portunus trituberculatus]|uniref:Uncharacterized protein n=1 Tax=Portunus trituberculatus TaxID=210409 RepID=A0A5B7EIH5_PORTR|nr:hypothetical protein [Portunus trituberculatus]
MGILYPVTLSTSSFLHTPVPSVVPSHLIYLVILLPSSSSTCSSSSSSPSSFNSTSASVPRSRSGLDGEINELIGSAPTCLNRELSTIRGSDGAIPRPIVHARLMVLVVGDGSSFTKFFLMDTHPISYILPDMIYSQPQQSHHCHWPTTLALLCPPNLSPSTALPAAPDS